VSNTFKGVGGIIANVRNAEGNPLGGPPAIRTLGDGGACHWVALQTYGGDADAENLARLDGWRGSLGKVKTFIWVDPHDRPAEAAAHVNQVMQARRADGVIADLEDPYEDGKVGADVSYSRTMTFLNTVQPSIPMALSTYQAPSIWRLWWRQLMTRCEAFLPQAYWNEQAWWTPRTMVADAWKVGQIVIGRDYRVRFTYMNLTQVRWGRAERLVDTPYGQDVVFHEGLNRWGVPVIRIGQGPAAGALLLAHPDRRVVNQKTRKIVGMFLGVASRDRVFPTVPCYQGALGWPSTTETADKVREASVAGASIYLAERASPDLFRAVAAALV